MLTSYGIQRVEEHPIDTPPPSTGNKTALVYYSLPGAIRKNCRTFLSGGKRVSNYCEPQAMAEFPRIFVQTEQMFQTGREQAHMEDCHRAPNCVIWDWSKFNYQHGKLKLGNSSDSTMLFPTMFHQDKDPQYPKDHWYVQDKPLHNRSLDFVFFGKGTPRRTKLKKDIQLALKLANFSTDHNNFGSNSAPVPFYKDAKICLIVHSFKSQKNTGGGEYHRMSDFFPSGCIPITELNGDPMILDILSKCGGVVVANDTDIPQAITQQLTDIQINPEQVQARRIAANTWWKEGFHWEQALEEVFGPREAIENGDFSRKVQV